MAMPHRTTAQVVTEILDSTVRIVDLSGDFRLRDPARYRQYYGVDHPAPQLLREGQFVYGLPELNRQSIASARYVASPGCFATAIALGLMPLAKAKMLAGPVHTVAITGSSRTCAPPHPATPPPPPSAH